MLFTGLVWGSYALSMQSSMIFHDDKNRLKAHLTLGDDAQKKAQKMVSGCAESDADMLGRIYKYKKPASGSKVELDTGTAAHKVGDVEQDIGWVYGRWQDYMNTDRHEQVWSIEHTNPNKASRI